MNRIFLSLIALSAACDPSSGPPVDCDAMAYASVSVTVLDEAGAPATDAIVQAAVNGGEAFDCDPVGDGEFVCGWEIAGEFEITASADGQTEVSTRTVVTGDACHVMSETVTLSLAVVGGLEAPEVWVFDDGIEADCGVGDCLSVMTLCPSGFVSWMDYDMGWEGQYTLNGDDILVSLDGGTEVELAYVDDVERVDGDGGTWRYDTERSEAATCSGAPRSRGFSG